MSYLDDVAAEAARDRNPATDYWDRPVFDDIAAEHHDEQQHAREQGHGDMVRDFLDQASDEELAEYEDQKRWRARSRRVRTYGGR